jgi:hypothetical protein
MKPQKIEGGNILQSYLEDLRIKDPIAWNECMRTIVYDRDRNDVVQISFDLAKTEEEARTIAFERFENKHKLENIFVEKRINSWECYTQTWH